VRIAAGTRAIAVRLAEDPATGDAYAFTLYPGEGRLVFDKVPNKPWFRYETRGQERPVRVDAGRAYDVRIVVDDSIATIYFDDIALDARMYDQSGTGIAIEVIDGAVTAGNIDIRALGSTGR
jgi:beta-fructofuranosidase